MRLRGCPAVPALIDSFERWTAGRLTLAATLDVKPGPGEACYERLMQQHPRLHAAFLRGPRDLSHRCILPSAPGIRTARTGRVNA